MKNWKAPSKILLLFVICLTVFLVLRLLVPTEYAALVLGIPGFILVGYMANLGAHMVRNPPPPPPPPPPPGNPDDETRTDPQ